MDKVEKPQLTIELSTVVAPESSNAEQRRSWHESPLSQYPVASLPVSTWKTDSILFFALGMSGWWTINAIMWAESPIFVAQTPEKQAIGSCMSVACQIGNIFPFIYKGVFSQATQAKILSWSILICQVLAIAAAVVCAMAWRVQVTLFGQPRSIALIACTMLAGGVGTLSNITFWAMAARYPGTHITKAMSIGTTFSGFVSAWVAVAQRAGSTPYFSADIFMLGVAAVQGVFMFLFAFIMHRPIGNPGIVGSAVHPHSRALTARSPRLGVRTASRAYWSSSMNPIIDQGSGMAQCSEDLLLLQCHRDHLPRQLILLAMFAVYALTYALPSLGPFMVSGYPTAADMARDIAVNGHEPRNTFLDRDDLLRYMNLLQQCGDVVGRAVTAFSWVPGFPFLFVLTLIVLGISGLLIVAAVLSAEMPKLFPGCSSLVFPAVFFGYYFARGFLVTVLYVKVKLDMPRNEAEHFSGNMGLSGQIGAFVSNLMLFVVINVFQWISAPCGN